MPTSGWTHISGSRIRLPENGHPSVAEVISSPRGDDLERRAVHARLAAYRARRSRTLKPIGGRFGAEERGASSFRCARLILRATAVVLVLVLVLDSPP